MRPARGTGVALVAIILLIAVGGGAAAAPVTDNLRVFFLPAGSYGPLFIAEREGYLARQQIKVTWVPFRNVVDEIPLLLQGALDVGGGTPTPAIFNAVAGGEPLRIVADLGHVAGRGNWATLIVRKELAGTVKSVKDLKGRRVVNPGGTGSFAEFAMTRILATVGMSTKDLQLINLPSPAILAALQGGSVDASVLPPPLDTQAIETGIGFKLLYFDDYFQGEHVRFLLYGRTLLQQNRQLGGRFMTAYLQAARRYSEGATPRNVAVISEYLKVPPEIVRKSGWTPVHADGFVDVTGLRRYQDWLYDLNLVAVRNPTSRLADHSFREQASELLGLPVR
jgi:ABC-type nitrate/sulfonate/bicarbonate transport system substrate-binding protein